MLNTSPLPGQAPTSRDDDQPSITLDDGDWRAFRSAYLSGGYKQDDLRLTAMTVGPDSGTLHVENFFSPSDGRFHLTVPAVFIAVGQLAIVYACAGHA